MKPYYKIGKNEIQAMYDHAAKQVRYYEGLLKLNDLKDWEKKFYNRCLLRWIDHVKQYEYMLEHK